MLPTRERTIKTWILIRNFKFFQARSVNPCLSESPCQNGGTCMYASATNSYTCICGSGFTGRDCETDLCLSQNCPQNSVCIGGTECKCLPGYQGKTKFIMPSNVYQIGNIETEPRNQAPSLNIDSWDTLSQKKILERNSIYITNNTMPINERFS